MTAMFSRAFTLEAGWWLKKCYPPFVYSPAISSPGGVPVFIFHSVEPEGFEEKLFFLSRNAYHTCSGGEFYGYISGDRALPARSVFLTFDDGDKTLYDYAYPLLKKYGMKAACFVCPGLIGDDKKTNPFVSWNEIMKMEKSGVVDFQSHTLSHERIFTGSKITGFYNPLRAEEKLGLSTPAVYRGGKFSRLDSPGAPLYESGSRMGRGLRYYDDEALRSACVDYVSRSGGVDFFKSGRWEKALMGFALEFRKKSGPGHFETKAKRRDEIYHSLAESRKMLEEKLGKDVRHLAYPWGYGSRDALSLSVDAGYRSNFWGPLQQARIGAPGIDPYYIPRLKDDYLFRLPGKGRKPLMEVFGAKLARRAAGKDIY